jgi:hypothetical protein
MTTLMQQQPISNDIRQQQQYDNKESSKKDIENTINIPDIIEERRRDSEGRTVTNKYMRGKLLGKVF